MNKGHVFDMQHFSVHDGPGIRTVVFLNGCPLHCEWCANPESQALTNHIMILEADCIGLDKCGLCKNVCPNNCISPKSETSNCVSIDRSRCSGCGACSQVCPGTALTNTLEEKTVNEVIDYVMKDRAYYEKSGGGVTLSGGEPLFQYDFALELLKSFKAKELQTAVETTAYCETEHFLKAAEYIDYFMIDIKSMDSAVHKQYTGVGNEKILANIAAVQKTGKPIEIRIPMIPGVNDSLENLSRTAEFVAEHVAGAKVTLLLYHRLGNTKYEQLGVDAPMKELLPVKLKEHPDYVPERLEVFKKLGIEAKC